MNVESTNLDPAALLIPTENTSASLSGLPENSSFICIKHMYVLKTYIEIADPLPTHPTCQITVGQVQNGRLYIRYRSSSQTNKAASGVHKAYRLCLFAILILNLLY